MKKKGILIGEFRLLHDLHKEVFMQSAGCVEVIHIGVINYKGIKRYSNIRELSITISKILNDIGIEFYIHEIKEELTNDELESYFINKLKIEDYSEWTLFTDESKRKFKKIKNEMLELFSNKEITVANIEKNIYESKHIAKEFMRYVNKKIVISGTESCGKTVMTKKVSSFLNTSFSEEYGRYHGRKFLGGNDSCFTPKEFVHIAMQQILQDKKVNMYSRLFLLVDTDMVVTLNFLNKYRDEYIKNNNWSDDLEEEYIKAKDTLETLIENHDQDLTILLKPNVKFVEDGIRWHDRGFEEREKEFNELKKLYDKFNIKYVVVDKKSYNERFKEVIKHIKNNF